MTNLSSYIAAGMLIALGAFALAGGAAADGEPRPRGPSTQILRSQTQTLGRAIQQSSRTAVRERSRASMPTDGTAQVTRVPVVLRASPSEAAAPVGRLDAGATVAVRGASGGWVEIAHDQGSAFVPGHDLAAP